MAAIDSRGTPLVIGTWPDAEPRSWTGLKASDLLLLAAASCSTYDVAEILNKQREPLESLEVRCTGEQESKPPHRFINIHLHYILKGALNPDKVKRAIRLSEDKYCSVTNTLRGAVAISSDFEIIL
jgi:putative redox protein